MLLHLHSISTLVEPDKEAKLIKEKIFIGNKENYQSQIE